MPLIIASLRSHIREDIQSTARYSVGDAAGLAVYILGLPGPLVLDDRNALASLASIYEGSLSIWNFVSGQHEGVLFRPISNASFVANWWLWGDNLLAFKAVNLLIHLLCGLAVFVLARLLLHIVISQQDPHVIDAAAVFSCACGCLPRCLLVPCSILCSAWRSYLRYSPCWV